MIRRTFLTLAGAAVAWPMTVRAEPAGKIARVGFLLPSLTPYTEFAQQPFNRGMRELGWEEGRNWIYVHTEHAADLKQVAAATAELVRAKVDVIVVVTLQVALAVQSLTKDIPIVVTAAGDPVGIGAAASLSRPGGRITGMTVMSPELAVKRLQRLVEIVPQASRIAILQNPDTPSTPIMVEAVMQAAKAIGLTARVFQARRPEEIEPAFDAIKEWSADGVVLLDDAMYFVRRMSIAAIAQARKLPVACPFREMARAGCLLSYSASIPDRFYRAATYVDKILKGASAADLPFEQPAKFEFIINLNTARDLGVDVPPMLLAIADEVIE